MGDQEWIVEGAAVAESGGKLPTVFTSIVRLTPTQIVLANGSRYRRADMKKVGEKRDPWNGRQRLGLASDTAEWMRRGAVSEAGNACYRLGGRGDQDAVARLDEMQAVIDAARARLAEIDDMASTAGTTEGCG